MPPTPRHSNNSAPQASVAESMDAVAGRDSSLVCSRFLREFVSGMWASPRDVGKRIPGLYFPVALPARRRLGLECHSVVVRVVIRAACSLGNHFASATD